MSSTEIGIEEARKSLGDLVTRVRYTRQPITLTRNGKPAARLMPLEDTVTTTTSYGTWNNHGDRGSLTVEQTVEAAFGAEGPEGFDVAAIVREYRDAINEALPRDTTLAGDEFYGPYHGKDTDADDMRTIGECVKSVDLWSIIERHQNAG